jgi:phosphoglycolate phosphatase-like HAD superfamily hydrolase
MKPQLILFDIDGTLIDTAGAGRRAMVRAFREVLGLDGFDQTTGVAFAGRTDPAIMASLCAALGFDAGVFLERRPEIESSFLRALEDEMRGADPRRRLLPGVLQLLRQLQSMEQVHLGLLTGNLEAGARIKLACFDLNRFFAEGGFGSDDPDRRQIARIALSRVSRACGVAFAPEDVTVVGDTHHDVDCARANGYRAVAVDSGWVLRECLERAAPDALLANLEDPGVLRALRLD